MRPCGTLGSVDAWLAAGSIIGDLEWVTARPGAGAGSGPASAITGTALVLSVLCVTRECDESRHRTADPSLCLVHGVVLSKALSWIAGFATHCAAQSPLSNPRSLGRYFRFRSGLTSHAAALPSSSVCSRALRVSEAARSNSRRASAWRPSLKSRSPRTLGSRW